ncbi:MAG: hypothetical protein KGZ68_01010 [Dechloromonas sp.]|nr:hypothetical protein [Dechloromonas sp.]
MSQRRFTDKPEIGGSVFTLADNHPAMVENRTLFPSTVVEVKETAPERLLVSGENNRKLGKTVEKGRFAGYALYQLSLEERATCPADCEIRGACYGNSMQMARRHRIVDSEIFFGRLEEEIKSLAAQNVGVLIRLHVLGDFPSVEYVAFWLDILSTYENVACFGYTHRLPAWLEGDEIGDAVESVKDQFPDRFRIRWSFSELLADGAKVVDETPTDAVIEDEIVGLVCPAQTDATACCATCALCWQSSGNCVLFVKHGKQLGPRKERAEEPQQEPEPAPTETLPPAPAMVRRIQRLEIKYDVKPAIVGSMPSTRLVDPATLLVEDAYQRQLSIKSKRLIEKIVAEWSFSKFKPPICAETAEGLFVIDGQHTAIAAVTHGGIPAIPVLLVPLHDVSQRAESFVAHNRDRVAMTPFDVFHAEVAAGIVGAAEIARIARECGCVIPRAQPARNYAKPGQITAINEVVEIYKHAGAKSLRRILTVAAMGRLTPITARPLRAIRRMFEAKDAYPWVAKYSDAEIAEAMAGIPGIDGAARIHAAKTGQDVQRACIMLIKDSMEKRRGVR